jgi:septum formation protein
MRIAFARAARLSSPRASAARPRAMAAAAAGAAEPSLGALLAAAGAPRVVLGSASSARRALMDELAAAEGFSYAVETADIDEKALRAPDPHALVLVLAHAKADAIIARMAAAAAAAAAARGADSAEGSGAAAAAAALTPPPLAGLLLTCDQVVVHEGQVLEKPADAAEARAMVAGYARAPATTVGAVVAVDLASGRRAEGVDAVEIRFAPGGVPATAVEALIAEGEVFWCAGGLMAEHASVAPHIESMGGGLDSVMGLPKALAARLLREVLLQTPRAAS